MAAYTIEVFLASISCFLVDESISVPGKWWKICNTKSRYPFLMAKYRGEPPFLSQYAVAGATWIKCIAAALCSFMIARCKGVQSCKSFSKAKLVSSLLLHGTSKLSNFTLPNRAAIWSKFPPQLSSSFCICFGFIFHHMPSKKAPLILWGFA